MVDGQEQFLMLAFDEPTKRYFRVSVEPDTVDGKRVYYVRHPEIPGCVADDVSLTEAVKRLHSVRRHHLGELASDGLPIPLGELAPPPMPQVYVQSKLLTIVFQIPTHADASRPEMSQSFDPSLTPAGA